MYFVTLCFTPDILVSSHIPKICSVVGSLAESCGAGEFEWSRCVHERVGRREISAGILWIDYLEIGHQLNGSYSLIPNTNLYNRDCQNLACPGLL